ncbi:MAG: tannase, partial [Atopobiaceae bacterium]|nr:tannase [Atopobiaceae bacterium]
MDEIRLTRRAFLASAIAGAGSLVACASGPGPESPEQASTPSTPDAPRVNLHEFDALKLDRSRWSYDEENDCYYQLGLPYCIHPTTGAIAQLAVYVPGAY